MTHLNTTNIPSHSLKGRIILITGASAGIGKSAALYCAEQGATVILLGRNLKKLEAVYDAIEASNEAINALEAEKRPQPAIYELNLKTASEQDYKALSQVISTEFGRLDGLLHNASELGQLGPLEHTSASSWQEIIQVNLTAPFLLTRALLPLLHQSANGRILFTSSSVGRQGRAYWGAYAASKAGIENLMQTLAGELEASRIKVNSFNPGATRTAMRAAAYPAEDPTQVKSPDSLAPVYGYLLSEQSPWHGEQLSWGPL
ncbi:MAG: hypothetical protein RL497_665 [Pseudomonadota bacterium]|jgi:NAD(P)-dependent dehydrogenase (short-subunit alcohol dehydrogenase family)